MPDLKAGEQIGAYVLDWRLGGGSFGEVWRAHEAATGDAVAIKLLTGTFSSPDTAGMRAEVETLAAAAGSRSEHVVHVLGGGSEPMPHIVMEYVEGSDLAALLKESGTITAERTIEIGLGVSDALRALYEQGIVHRDIKPANVMIDSHGLVKLADFGIAKIVGYETITMTGQAAMTMAYAAPEVWEDDSSFGRPSHRSDLYAMGILLYQCLTGMTPFRGNYGALYRQHAERAPDLAILPPETPPSLRMLIARCLEKRQDQRPKDATACIAMLERAEAELKQHGTGMATGEPEKFGPWLKGEPHPTQPWAWTCRHSTSGDAATVEVHFSDSLDYGARLRKAVTASSKLASYGGERLIDSNRLLLRPDEAWHSPLPGQFQFWVAREDLPQRPATAVTMTMLRTATFAMSGLLAAADWDSQAVTLSPEDVTVLPTGAIYVRRPGLVQGTMSAAEQSLSILRGLPLEQPARDFIAGATSFDDLVQKFSNASAPVPQVENATTFVSEATRIAPARRAVCVACNKPMDPTDAWCPSCGHKVGEVVPTSAVGQAAGVEEISLRPPLAAALGAGALGGGLAMRLLPSSSSKTPGAFDIVLSNPGTQPVQAMLSAYDPEGALAFQMPSQAVVRPGGAERVHLQVSPKSRRRFGGKRSLAFTVAAAGAGGFGLPPVSVDGQYDDQPASFLPLAGGVLGLGIAAVLAFVLLSGGGDKGNSGSGVGQSNATGGGAASNGAIADFTTPTAVAPTVAPATAVPPTPVPPTPEPPTPTPPVDIPPPAPIIRTCDQIRGTPYQSEEERQFFLANCSTVAPGGGGGTAPGGGGGTAPGGGGVSPGGGGGLPPAPTPIPPTPRPAPVNTTCLPVASIPRQRASASGFVGLSITGGPGSTHRIGECIVMCYYARANQRFRMYDLATPGTNIKAGVDDGQGECFNVTLSPPLGTDTIRIDALNAANQVVESATISITLTN